MQDSHNEMLQLLSSILGVLPGFSDANQNPEINNVITLAQLGNNERLLQAKYAGALDTPVRIYSGDPKVILPIVLNLMNDTTTLVAADDSKLVYEAIQLLTQNYMFLNVESQQEDNAEDSNPCQHCSGCTIDETDAVHHPTHYQLPGLNGLEVMDVRSSLLQTIPEGVPYELVTCWNESWTYLTRMWGKNGLEDAKKAQVYLSRLIELWEHHNHSH